MSKDIESKKSAPAGSGLDPNTPAVKAAELMQQARDLEEADKASAESKKEVPAEKSTGSDDAALKLAEKLYGEQLERARKEAEDKKAELEQIKSKLSEYETASKQEKEKKMSETEKLQEMLKMQSEQLAELKKQNELRDQQFEAQKVELLKKDLLSASTLLPRLHKFVAGNTKEEIQASIQGLIEDQKAMGIEAVKSAKPDSRLETIGNPGSSPVANDGIPSNVTSSDRPVGYNKKKVDLIANNIKDVRQLADIINQDPDYRKIMGE